MLHEIISKISFSVVWKLNSNFFAWLENNLFVREWVHLALNFRAKLQVLNKVSNKELSVCTKDAKMGREQKQMVLQEILFKCTPGLWFYGFYFYVPIHHFWKLKYLCTFCWRSALMKLQFHPNKFLGLISERVNLMWGKVFLSSYQV